MSQPDVLLLDEPLSGQDADSREVFVEKVRDLKKRGKHHIIGGSRAGFDSRSGR